MDIKRYESAAPNSSLRSNRAGYVSKKTEEEYLNKKEQLESKKSIRIDRSFESTTLDTYEAEFKRQTVGLQTAHEFREKRKNLKIFKEDKTEAPVFKRKKTKLGPLSFSIQDEEDDDEEMVVPLIKKNMKNPHVETSFLPDAERDAREEEEKIRLHEEYQLEQERIRNETISILYTYWDGAAGTDNRVDLIQNTKISAFLKIAREQLCAEFPELKRLYSNHLMVVKDGFILPSECTFYDLTIRKKMNLETPSRVVQRYWYDKNKHIYPANQWKYYDPKEDDA